MSSKENFELVVSVNIQLSSRFLRSLSGSKHSLMSMVLGTRCSSYLRPTFFKQAMMSVDEQYLVMEPMQSSSYVLKMCAYSTEEEDLLTCLSDDHKSAIFLQKAVVELGCISKVLQTVDHL